jgi:hypothetical protein
VITIVDGIVNGHLLIDGSINETLIPVTPDIPLKVSKYDNEKDLLQGFLDLWIESKPDKIVYHNGDSYDMPYLIRRIKINDIQMPQLGKVTSTEVRGTGTKIIYTQSVMGIEPQLALDIEGVEIIDLLHFFRRFNPGLSNYRLETIGQLFLGEGKSGLEIQEMFDIVKSRDANRMAEVGWYSFKDTVLLYRLYTLLEIDDLISGFSDIILCTNEELLRMSDTNLIRRIMTKIDPCLSLSSFSITNPTHYIPMKPGFYKKVKLYGYENLITKAFEYLIEYYRQLGGDYTTYVSYMESILDGIRYLPCNLQNIAIYSSIVKELIPDILINLLSQLPNVISVDENYVYTQTEVDLDSILGLPRAKYSLILSLSNSSYIVAVNPNFFLRYGNHKLCRPSYPYIRELVDSYMIDIMTGRNPTTHRENIQTINPSRLVISIKVKSVDHYKPRSELIQARISRLLNSQGVIIDTWIKVNYLLTVDGLYLIGPGSPIESSPPIDIQAYQNQIGPIYKLLDKLANLVK